MPKTFGKELRDWRLANKLQFKNAGDLFGVGMSTYSKWEYGLRTPTKLSQAEIRRRMATLNPAST